MLRSFAAGALALGFVLGSGLAGLAAPMRFTDFYVFGDSLSDDGNLFAASGGAVPPAPYWQGRFSNGPVWSELVAGDFAARGLATENYARGFAAVGPAPFRPVGVPPSLDLGGQIAAFGTGAAGGLGARPLASIWIGANDQFFNGVPTGTAREVGRASANGVAAGARALRDMGVNDLMLLNLPALDLIPAYALIDPSGAEEARRGTLAFNRTLARRADGLRSRGMNVIEIDIYGLFLELLDDPARFGVLNATDPCFIPNVVYCGEAAAPLLAFFDPAHPSSTIHAAVADVVRGKVAPVPLPAPVALIALALAALAVVRQRRAAA
jgi:outer membrane lipase/esterase